MITFKKNSWHGFILNKLSPFETYSIDNICQLVRRLAITMLVLWPIVITASGVVLTAVLSALYFDFLWLFSNPAFTKIAVIGNMILGVAVTIAVVFSIAFGIDVWRNKLSDTEPGVIRTYTKSIHDKICTMVGYE